MCEGSFKVLRYRMMKGDQGVPRPKLGMPRCTPKKYSRRLKCLSLGMPPLHPLLRQQLWGLSPCDIFLFLHMLCAELGASILGCLFCLLLISWTQHACVGEKHAPLFLRILYVEYCILVSSYCLLVCSYFSYLSFARAYWFSFQQCRTLCCVSILRFLEKLFLLDLLYLAFSR